MPESVPLNTNSGYFHNTVSGDSIEPIINSTGQQIITGNKNFTPIVEDDWGNLWVGTSNGLNRLDFGAMSLDHSESEKGTQLFDAVPVYVFSYMDGLKEINFYRNAALIDKKNQAWRGTGKNLVMLDLENYSTANKPPVVHLTQLDIDNQFIDYQNIPNKLTRLVSFTEVEKFENVPQDLELNYKANHLTFYFVGIDWAAPQKIKYSYKLEGLSDVWSDPSSLVLPRFIIFLSFLLIEG